MERPLKEFSSKDREMQTLFANQGNLAVLAKDYDNACEKVDKLGKKGNKAAPNKVAKAAEEVEQATMQWRTEARITFEGLQLVDESRLNLLRDVLTQFQTHELDQVERERTTAEDCLNTLLNIETGDEIGGFVAKIISGNLKGETQSSRTLTGNTISASTPSIPFNDARSHVSGASPAPARGEAGQTRNCNYTGSANSCSRPRNPKREIWRFEETRDCHDSTEECCSVWQRHITRKTTKVRLKLQGYPTHPRNWVITVGFHVIALR